MGSAEDPLRALIAQGMQFEAAGDAVAAAGQYEQILAQNPEYFLANLHLAKVLNRNSHYAPALQFWEKCQEKQGGDLEVLTGYGDCLFGLHRYEEAIGLYQKAVKKLNNSSLQLSNQDKASLLFQLAHMYGRADQYDQAEATYFEVIKYDPHYARAYGALAHVYSVMGRSDKAIEYYRKALQLDPNLGLAHKALADQMKHAEMNDDIRAMQAAYDARDIDPFERVNVAFALGKVHEDLGEYKKAFGYWKEGNMQYRKLKPYDVSIEFPAMETMKKLFNPAFVSAESEHDSGQITPILLVGMPRTGSSLLEQILASHSAVHGAGESEAMYKVITAASQGDLDNLYPLKRSDWLELGRQYMAELGKGAGDKPYVVDKMLINYLSIGIARMMLPNAKIIHCKRDPMAVALSSFKQIFMPGVQDCTYDLKDFGIIYRKYEQLMKHWHKVIPGWVCDVEYENLIASPEPQVRRVLDFIGLPFEEACMSFYETYRPIKTASIAQVRQPLYKSSVKGWKRYEKELSPFKKARKGRWFGMFDSR